MSAAKTEKLNVTLSAEVKARLVADAVAQESTINDVAVRALAEHFGIPFEGTGRSGPGAQAREGAVVLPVPTRVYAKLDGARRAQPKGSRTKRAVVEAILREHYQLA